MDPLALIATLLRKTPAGEKTILELDLDFSVLSAPPGNPLQVLRAINSPTMRALREGLREAALDQDVLGLIVHLGTCPLTASQGDELGDALVAFGTHKPVWAHTESFAEIGTALLPYVLATSASQIWLQESGQLGLGGVRAAITLLRGSLDKVGLEPEFSKRQEYKSAADSYSAHQISDANREMIQRIADSITAHAVATIARRRALPVEQVQAALEDGILRPAEALGRGLIDRIGYRDEVYAAARKEWEGGGPPAARLRYVHRYAAGAHPFELVTQRTRPAIAVVGIRGGIVSGRPQPQGPGGQPTAAAEQICQQLRAAGRDEHVKAVILRVESPGGSYIASDSIRREVLRLKQAGRPVVASMGDLAASGGYFVAMPATEIVANPVTLTGSIGVFAGKFVTTELKRKIGLVSEDVVAGRWASFLSGNQKFTDEQWAALNRRLDDIYLDFTTKAAADRGLALDVLEPLARGRVWTGADAHERGLVDHLGGMDLAIDRACSLAGVNRDQVAVRPVSLLGFLGQFRPAESSESIAGGAAVGAPRPGADLESVIQQFAGVLGLEVPGVLSLPYRIAVS